MMKSKVSKPVVAKEKDVTAIASVSLSPDEKEDLIEQIQQAFRNWEEAQIHFNYADNEDEIDYTIYMLEAAEKRLSMLLRKAKQSHAHVYYYR
ncbi:DUF2508 family protein [Paenibacillus sp. UMB4589-SE434]|uniref:DUF2508 family protein n=1 Tax=Paenibacillus sp. UMB4589-SE434 TaxID=3046314 RepID=UPI00254EB07F|nr:DUF2508 family protein [Paenibacillus sp. UMB4589-SE434]MDK8184000.1 DUF2508 family protein [Paenibacillus sp. UMB4589-SE434]